MQKCLLIDIPDTGIDPPRRGHFPLIHLRLPRRMLQCRGKDAVVLGRDEAGQDVGRDELGAVLHLSGRLLGRVETGLTRLVVHVLPGDL